MSLEMISKGNLAQSKTAALPLGYAPRNIRNMWLI